MDVLPGDFHFPAKKPQSETVQGHKGGNFFKKARLRPSSPCGFVRIHWEESRFEFLHGKKR